MEMFGTDVVLLAVAAIIGMRLANVRSATLVLQEFKVDRLPSKRSKKEVEMGPQTLLLPLGLIFGLYPARRAAMMNLIKAFRPE